MPNRISDKTRFKQGRGTGKGANYSGWIKPREINSIGTTFDAYDWKRKRMIGCLSEGEAWWFYKLRFSEYIEDVYDQYPLAPLQETIDIAESFGYKGSFNNNVVMTTDFLVTKTDGTKYALSVKYSEDKVSKRNKECLSIEREYWKRRNIPFFMGYKKDLNITEIKNIMDVIEAYDPIRVWDDKSFARYLIAHHYITVDITTSLIDINEIVKTYKGTEIWNRKLSELTRS